MALITPPANYNFIPGLNGLRTRLFIAENESAELPQLWTACHSDVAHSN